MVSVRCSLCWEGGAVGVAGLNALAIGRKQPSRCSFVTTMVILNTHA